ncbi:MAG: hypothetical protein KatS3mg027_0460 [Bacteroidia bacterium]|nr:MAG: hypothetical protein KatS3mg027_0460 [Bacteroidia bacterium]
MITNNSLKKLFSKYFNAYLLNFRYGLILFEEVILITQTLERIFLMLCQKFDFGQQKIYEKIILLLKKIIYYIGLMRLIYNFMIIIQLKLFSIKK